MAKFSSSAPAGKSSFSPSTIFLVLTGANRGAKYHRPNDAPFPQLRIQAKSTAVDVDRGERKDVLPSTWSPDCFHTYAQRRSQLKTVTHGLSFVEIYKNSGRERSTSERLK